MSWQTQIIPWHVSGNHNRGLFFYDPLTRLSTFYDTNDQAQLTLLNTTRTLLSTWEDIIPGQVSNNLTTDIFCMIRTRDWARFTTLLHKGN